MNPLTNCEYKKQGTCACANGCLAEATRRPLSDAAFAALERHSPAWAYHYGLRNPGVWFRGYPHGVLTSYQEGQWVTGGVPPNHHTLNDTHWYMTRYLGTISEIHSSKWMQELGNCDSNVWFRCRRDGDKSMPIHCMDGGIWRNIYGAVTAVSPGLWEWDIVPRDEIRELFAALRPQVDGKKGGPLDEAVRVVVHELEKFESDASVAGPNAEEPKLQFAVDQKIHHPNYYQAQIAGMRIEARDVTHAYDLNHSLASAVEYLLRAGRKDPKERTADIKKAVWHLRWELEETRLSAEERYPFKGGVVDATGFHPITSASGNTDIRSEYPADLINAPRPVGLSGAGAGFNGTGPTGIQGKVGPSERQPEDVALQQRLEAAEAAVSKGCEQPPYYLRADGLLSSLPEGNPTHYVQCNSGNCVFVKEAGFFRAQGGLTQSWGSTWKPVYAAGGPDAIEEARAVGCALFPNADRNMISNERAFQFLDELRERAARNRVGMP